MAGMVLVEKSVGGGCGGFDNYDDDDDEADTTNFCPRIKHNKINESMKYEMFALQLCRLLDYKMFMEWMLFFSPTLYTSVSLLVKLINRYAVNTI